MNSQKKIITVNDISCAGRCSITVIHPILSSAGFETIVLPSAVLSTHTGGFENYTFLDLTSEMKKIIAHWKTLNRSYDAILSGYLGSKEQIEIVLNLINELGTKDTLIVVDPVMADNGSLYPGFDKDFPKLLKALIKKADVIVPNLTEASLLLDIPYKENYTSEEIINILQGLSSLGPQKIVLTGVIKDGRIGAQYYDAATKETGYISTKRFPSYYHGTGDVFTATFTGALMNDISLKEATTIAVLTTYKSISEFLKGDEEKRYGVPFEKIIPYYLSQLKKSTHKK